ncbi:ABC transporter substrate-binding protein [Actinoplanes sp. G11-F43]|uniref:ABC transporter substrate-binding protein n=1 Tax=Actinoplanes sp. G11-F43 TaxID=3424130 RepID=UPI003D348171
MRSLRWAAALLSATLFLSACGGGDSEETGAPAAAEKRTVTAGNGTIEIPAAPQRIVTIGNTTLPLIDMGGTPVGVTEISASELGLIPAEQKATYDKATVLGSSGDQVDMEKLAGLRPDLILAQLPASEFELIKKQMESVAPTVFWGLDVEWKELAGGLAEAGNVSAGLTGQKTEFEAKVAKIQQTYGKIIDSTKFVNVDRWESSDPGTFSIADFGCVEIAQGDIDMDFPRAAAGADPLGWTSLPFEQIKSLSEYDVITYPVDAQGRPTKPFAPVAESNTWKALPAVGSGRALGLFCPGNNSYGPVLRYLDSLDAALATLPTKE